MGVSRTAHGLRVQQVGVGVSRRVRGTAGGCGGGGEGPGYVWKSRE